MATPVDILELRGLVAEPDEENGWTDEKLGALLDAGLTVNGAAARIWTQKAADAVLLVDVTESGSSRKLSDIRKNAMEMAGHFAGLDNTDTGGTAGSGPVISRIRRGFT